MLLPRTHWLLGALLAPLVLVGVASGADAAPAMPSLDTGSTRTQRALAFTPDGRTLVAGGDAGEVLAFDPDTGKRRWTYTASGPVRALAVSPDGRRVAVGWTGTSLDLVDAATGRRVGQVLALPGRPSHLAFSPKGDRLAVVGQFQHVALFDPANGQRVARLLGAISWLNGVAFSPDGRKVAAAGWDHGVRVWDLGTGKLERSYFEHKFAANAVAFTRDGAYVVSSSDDQSLVLYNLEGYLQRRVRGPSVGPLGQSRATEVMIGGTWNGRVVFFRELQLAPIKVLPAHRGPVHAVALAPGGQVAASAGADGKVKLWKVP